MKSHGAITQIRTNRHKHMAALIIIVKKDSWERYPSRFLKRELESHWEEKSDSTCFILWISWCNLEISILKSEWFQMPKIWFLMCSQECMESFTCRGVMHIHLNSACHLKDNLIYKFITSCPISRTASSKELTLFSIFLSIISCVVRATEIFLGSWLTNKAVWPFLRDEERGLGSCLCFVSNA